MKAEKLKLSGFRNLSDLEIKPHPRLNVLYGGNGAGKTNLCEALHFASTGKALKGRKQEELIKWDKSELLIRISLEDKDEVVIYLREDNSKQVKLNGKNVSQKEMEEKMPVISFVPTDLDAIKGGPANRRELVNDYIGPVSSDYRNYLKDYQSELNKKNALLKKEKINKEFLNVLNERIIELGSEISYIRFRFIKKINKFLIKSYRKISGGEKETKAGERHRNSTRGPTQGSDRLLY